MDIHKLSATWSLKENKAGRLAFPSQDQRSESHGVQIYKDEVINKPGARKGDADIHTAEHAHAGKIQLVPVFPPLKQKNLGNGILQSFPNS